MPAVRQKNCGRGCLKGKVCGMKQWKMAILGAGHIAQTMARTMAGMPNVECYAVASRSLTKAQEFAKRFGFYRAYGSYEELVLDDAVELIYIMRAQNNVFCTINRFYVKRLLRSMHRRRKNCCGFQKSGIFWRPKRFGRDICLWCRPFKRY